jgi:hypothetical protein
MRSRQQAAITARTAHNAPMQVRTEPLAPWLIGALAMASLLIVGYFTEGVGYGIRAALVVALAALVTAAALVAAQSRAGREAVMHEHRQRPTAEQLADDVPLFVGDGSSYVIGMLGWTEAVSELLSHAIAASGDTVSDELLTARGDAAALQQLLREAAVHHPSNVGIARLHWVSTLWELDQPRIEAIAAEADPAFHRRWRARSVIARRLRRGDPAAVASLVVTHTTEAVAVRAQR